VQRNLYNPFEKGRRRITIDVATKIRDRYGISLDWIYCADQRVLPSDLYQKLDRRQRIFTRSRNANGTPVLIRSHNAN
jgi:transcriptional regulator with XRE-family HTH domain